MPAKLTTDVNRPAVPLEGATVTAEVDGDPGQEAQSVARHVALAAGVPLATVAVYLGVQTVVGLG